MSWITHIVAQTVKNLPAMQETLVLSLDQEDPLEKEMETHSSTLAWRIPWAEEPGRLQSMGHKESDMTITFTTPHRKSPRWPKCISGTRTSTRGGINHSPACKDFLFHIFIMEQFRHILSLSKNQQSHLGLLSVIISYTEAMMCFKKIKIMYPNVHHSTVYNSQDMETT